MSLFACTFAVAVFLLPAATVLLGLFFSTNENLDPFLLLLFLLYWLNGVACASGSPPRTCLAPGGELPGMFLPPCGELLVHERDESGMYSELCSMMCWLNLSFGIIKCFCSSSRSCSEFTLLSCLSDGMFTLSFSNRLCSRACWARSPP